MISKTSNRMTREWVEEMARQLSLMVTRSSLTYKNYLFVLIMEASQCLPSVSNALHGLDNAARQIRRHCADLTDADKALIHEILKRHERWAETH